MVLFLTYGFFFFKQKTAYEMRISDWSSDVCSSDLYWIVVASADHIRTAVDGHFVQAGHGRRAPVETFHHGDWVACYAPRERMSAGAKVQAFKAVGEVVGDQVLAVDRNAIGMHHRRSEAHTSELQTLMRNSYAVLCTKKKYHS